MKKRLEVLSMLNKQVEVYIVVLDPKGGIIARSMVVGKLAIDTQIVSLPSNLDDLFLEVADPFARGCRTEFKLGQVACIDMIGDVPTIIVEFKPVTIETPETPETPETIETIETIETPEPAIMHLSGIDAILQALDLWPMIPAGLLDGPMVVGCIGIELPDPK